MPDVALQSAEKRIGEHSRLTDDDEILVWRLHQAGKSQTEIADIVSCHQSTVSRCLKKLDDSRDLAKSFLHASALKTAQAAITGSVKAAKHGKPEAALEVLDRLDVAPKRREDQHSAQVLVVVQQGNSIPGISSLHALSPLPFASNAPIQGAGSD